MKCTDTYTYIEQRRMNASKRMFALTDMVENKNSRSSKIPKLSVNDSAYMLFDRNSKGGVGGWIGSVIVYLYQRVFNDIEGQAFSLSCDLAPPHTLHHSRKQVFSLSQSS